MPRTVFQYLSIYERFVEMYPTQDGGCGYNTYNLIYLFNAPVNKASLYSRLLGNKYPIIYVCTYVLTPPTQASVTPRDTDPVLPASTGSSR